MRAVLALCLCLLAGSASCEALRTAAGAQGAMRGRLTGAEGTGASGASGESGVSGEGDSGESGEGVEEELNQEEKYAAVASAGEEHNKNLQELKDAMKTHSKTTLDAKIVNYRKGVHADLTGDALTNVLTTNTNAQKALNAVAESKKKLDDAKTEAGLLVGAMLGKNSWKKQLCRKRIVEKEKDARRMENKLHNQQAKARAAGEFLVVKLRKAHEAAKAVSDQSSHWGKQFRLDVARNATMAADAARDESNKAKQLVDRLADAVENARMASKRIADECAAALGPVQRKLPESPGADPDLRGIKKDPKVPEEKPTLEDAMKAHQTNAVEALNAAISNKDAHTKNLVKAGKWLQQQIEHVEDGESGASGAQQEEGAGASGAAAAPKKEKEAKAQGQAEQAEGSTAAAPGSSGSAPGKKCKCPKCECAEGAKTQEGAAAAESGASGDASGASGEAGASGADAQGETPAEPLSEGPRGASGSGSAPAAGDSAAAAPAQQKAQKAASRR